MISLSGQKMFMRKRLLYTDKKGHLLGTGTNAEASQIRCTGFIEKWPRSKQIKKVCTYYLFSIFLSLLNVTHMFKVGHAHLHLQQL